MNASFTHRFKGLVCSMAVYNNEASYKELFYLLFTPLFRLSLSMLKNKEQAEEIASDVLLRLWQNRMDLMEIENVKVYALTIARNLSLNYLRSSGRTRLISLENLLSEEQNNVLPPDQILINHENTEHLFHCIESLPTRCKIVFKLVKEEGLSYKEVAEVLSISAKTVDAHLVTAMKKLSESLKGKKV